MNKFWKWMEKKGYGDKGDADGYVVYGAYDDCILASEQMLIGYMIEYLEEMVGESKLVLRQKGKNWRIGSIQKPGEMDWVVRDLSLSKALDKCIEATK